MTVAIVYQSVTGNTEMLANAIREEMENAGAEVVYFGAPKGDIEADLYFVGSWTNKGMCTSEIAEFLKTLQNKTIVYFATAGFGGANTYYSALAQRVKEILPEGTKMRGAFFCQGKMPMSVRERYVQMMTAHPDDKKLQVSLNNFDAALSHPDETDLQNARRYACECLTD